MTDGTAELRRTAYRLFTVVAVAICVAKIVGAENLIEPSRYRPPTATSFGADRDDSPPREWPSVRPEPTPMFSSNDKSRWATVRALVEDGTYVIGRRQNYASRTAPYGDSGTIINPQNGKPDSLDIVMNPDTGAFYSSKPPLFATLLAGEYWLLFKVCGLSLDRDRFPVVILMLLTVNVLPFAVYLVLLARLIEAFGTTDFGRLFTFASAAVATYLTTFSMTLNNHTPAAYCVLFSIYPLMMRAKGGEFAAGFFAGAAATFELPALAFAGGLGAFLLLARPRRALLLFLPGVLIPLVALAACNVVALGTLRPAYTEFGGPWYEYGGSHWLKLKDAVRPRGIDFNDESTLVYGFHTLVGHHGWFSLSPIWLVALAGFRRMRLRSDDARLGMGNLALLTCVVSVVVYAFYLSRTSSYNYGGNTSGLRWLFWLTPLWLMVTLAGADRLANRPRLRVLAYLALGVSILSVFYPAANPWRYPWPHQFAELAGWVRY